MGWQIHRRAMARCLVLIVSLMLATPLTAMALDTGSRGDVLNTDSEPNDAPVMATEIDLSSGIIPGDLGGLDKTDFYKVHLAFDDLAGAADRLEVNVLFDNIGAEPSATLYDPWGFVLDHGIGDNITLQVVTAIDLVGFFYIQVGLQTGSTAYELGVDIHQTLIGGQDQNNHPSSSIEVSSSDWEYNSYLQARPYAEDVQDFYKVSLISSGKGHYGFVSVHMDVLSGSYRLELYDEYYTLLADYQVMDEPFPGTPSDLSYMAETTGDFYLRVWAVNGSGEYWLTFDIFTLEHQVDGDLEHATEVDLGSAHYITIKDSLGYNSYPGESDVSDIYNIPLVKGEVVRGRITSDRFDARILMPNIRIELLDGTGSPYIIGTDDEYLIDVVEPEGEFQIKSRGNGSLFVRVWLEMGGGEYTLDLYKNRPPQLVDDAVIEVTIDDSEAVTISDLGSVFFDPEGDGLVYDYLGIEDLDGGQLSSCMDDVWVDPSGLLWAPPKPRCQGKGLLRVSGSDHFIEGQEPLTVAVYSIEVVRSDAFKVEVLDPYGVHNTVPDPIILVLGKKEHDHSLDLSSIFLDPLTGSYENQLYYNVEVVNDDLIEAVPETNPWPNMHSNHLYISLTQAGGQIGDGFETRVLLSAHPVAHPEDESETVALTVIVEKNKGVAPVLDLPSSLHMKEDTPYTIDLDEHVSDLDPVDVGAHTYVVETGSTALSAMADDRSNVTFVPASNWCGLVKDVKITVTDFFGWSVLGTLDIEVMCSDDGPMIIYASPDPSDKITIYEGEETVLTVFAKDADAGRLTYDWLINGHPEVADGGIGFVFSPPFNTAGIHNITVVVTNPGTGLTASRTWKVEVRHINIAPTGRIEVIGSPGKTLIDVDAGDGVEFLGVGEDPEKLPLDYHWDFGDGGTAKGKRTTHTFERPGDYVVTLIVSDGELQSYSHVNVKVRSKTSIVSTPPTIPWVHAVWLVSIILIVTAVGMGSTEPGKYRIFVSLALLYSKLKKTEVLDHYLRGRIQGYITANPGAHYNMIKTDLQINNGNLAYHLKVLETQGYIKSLRDGIFKRFYPETMKVARPPSLQERILVLLRGHPGLTQKDIARMLDQSQSTINDYIRRMVGAQLIRIERDGVRNFCYVMSDEDIEKGRT